MPNTPVEEAPAGVPVMSWDSWPDHPTWKTERQLAEAGLIAWGNPVACVWYSNKYIRRAGKKGHYLMLYDETLAKPKQVDEKKKAAAAKAKSTAKLNRTCSFCNRLQENKIERADRICEDCWQQAGSITDCQKWLAMPNLVVLDTETTGLYPGNSEIIQIAVIDVEGNTLLDSFIKPSTPIIEEFGEETHDWPYHRATAYEINGITNEMVKDAPTFPELYPALCELLKDKFVVIYNSEFDIDMLNGDCKRHGLDKVPFVDSACAMWMYAGIVNEWNRRGPVTVSLGDAAHMEKVRTGFGAHRALGDCLQTLAIIKSVASKPKAPVDQ